MSDRKYKRPKARIRQIVVGHDLPPYEPKAGDIVLAYHLFDDPKDLQSTFSRIRDEGGDVAAYLKERADRGHSIAKFRPCVVMAAQDGRALLVPISSKPHRARHHLEISEESELADAGMDPSKPAYAKVLETAVYDIPHPLIHAVRDADGNPSWTIGTASKPLRAQIRAEIRRQQDKRRLSRQPANRTKAAIPQAIVDEQDRFIAEAQSRRRPRHTSYQTEGVRTGRTERIRAAAEDRARQDGAHPDQRMPGRLLAEDLARRRGTHPEQQASQPRRDAPQAEAPRE